MANSRAGNVVVVDTTGTTVAEGIHIVGIKYIGAASGTATLKAGSSSGNPLWEESGTANVFNQVDIKEKDGVHVILGTTAKVYLYLK